MPRPDLHTATCLAVNHEMPEFNLGNTYNYGDMAALIAPRPFMVERGHDDTVAPDTWVAHEFARVQYRYTKLGIGDRAEIEVFNGPHTINGDGTFKFLDKHLKWPEKLNGIPSGKTLRFFQSGPYFVRNERPVVIFAQGGY